VYKICVSYIAYIYITHTPVDCGGRELIVHTDKLIAKGNQTFVAIDTCLARTPDVEMKTSENVYDISCESRPGVATKRLADGSGAARHLQKVLLQIDKRYYFSVICISGK
jgi:hypothetical protein